MNTLDEGYGDWKRDQTQDEKSARVMFDHHYKRLHTEIAQAAIEQEAAEGRRLALVAELHKLINEQAWRELEP